VAVGARVAFFDKRCSAFIGFRLLSFIVSGGSLSSRVPSSPLLSTRRSKSAVTDEQLRQFEPVRKIRRIELAPRRRNGTKRAAGYRRVSRMAIDFFGLHKFEMTKNLRRMAAQDCHKTAKQMLKSYIGASAQIIA
jgi:hypothetical protein